MARISDLDEHLVVHVGRELVWWFLRGMVLAGWEGTGFMVLGPLGST